MEIVWHDASSSTNKWTGMEKNKNEVITFALVVHNNNNNNNLNRCHLIILYYKITRAREGWRNARCM